MLYSVGDVPVHDIEIEPARDLDDFSAVSASLVTPAGDESIVLAAEITAPDEEDEDVSAGALITVHWPAGSDSILEAAGIYWLLLSGTATGGKRERLARVPIVVQDDMNGWTTLDDAREEWKDAPQSDRWLYELLEVAKNDVVAFAPNLSESVGIPPHYRRAQIMHARDVWTAAEVSGDGAMGEGTFMITPKPLDWMVRQILRPRTAGGKAVVG